MLRLAAVLSLLAVTAASARDISVPPASGEDMRVQTAPADLETEPEGLEIAGGLVWLVLEDGTTSPKATKVPHGVYVTTKGYANLEASVAKEVGDLKAEVARLNAELAKRTPPGVPVSEQRVTAATWSTPVIVAVAVVTGLGAGFAGCRIAGGCK